MRNIQVLKYRLSCAIFTSFLLLTLPNLSLAQTNPCAPFMGSITAPGRLVHQTAPEATRRLVEDGIDIALLIPV